MGKEKLAETTPSVGFSFLFSRGPETQAPSSSLKPEVQRSRACLGTSSSSTPGCACSQSSAETSQFSYLPHPQNQPRVCSAGGPEFLIFPAFSKARFKVPKCFSPSVRSLPRPLMPVARMKPSSPRVSSPSPPSHKLELQTLKLEELTVSLVCSVFQGWPSSSGLAPYLVNSRSLP